ncbi:CIS tube protein [Streptomyces violaceus]|uniref:Nucleoid-associated protein YgaU n=2 Tax=Streptomyces TaxID=1883 RepID=A0A7W4ZXK6_9ACTN|nr:MULTISPECIES: LysM peptidoglycan-binding domain-containing protein [Streptomyces]MBB3080482.1 nucleoid-associated protein YgaU [Streptomyces violarus]MCT9145043.1 LysM peptidoglycan-binding domain-containing protein [Streptomyces violarus]WNF65347.1 LysM peptidoglycan-binding domain-containing protein [Streptomyces sp. CGMCC 4.1456]WRT98321.1 LysM peptidoglycan-binding domain-containing protein [Streptomyces sp. CGMCC 4.1772]
MARASSRGAGKSLVRATLAIHEPPVGKSTTPGGIIKTFGFDFNPAQLSLTRRAQWKSTPAQIERDGALPEFMGAEAREMGVEIFLDSSTKPSGNTVLKKVESLLACCEVTNASIAAKQPSPPWVVFQWGSFSTARFTAYVSSVEATYSLFGTTGVPIRATCRLQLHEIPSKTKRQNPTSGALTAQRVHRVVAGDSLQSLAWREYGNAAAWRSIAEANGIDDPSRLPAGAELVLPAAEEVRP